ncbi:hypothetical protein GS4_26_00320 [Gordonia soli NBRC 108243]|uniref:Uncharacterized protein n=1 Tax=Gordonia soli NBRC 108243 TaxID=1223545 RepID=M0QMD9_9ACTN|nr:hypothetical protein GS4_26_00320 [Gordonia soli NBRC 108243]
MRSPGSGVGLPASECANKHGQPIMRGGKKLAEDLSLPRLRETSIDDDNARAQLQPDTAHGGAHEHRAGGGRFPKSGAVTACWRSCGEDRQWRGADARGRHE